MNPIRLSAAWLFLIAGSLGGGAGAHRPVKVHVDRATPTGICRLEIGVTHTQNDLDSARANPEAVGRVKRLLSAACRYQVEPIMGWGADNPEPAPGIYQ